MFSKRRLRVFTVVFAAMVGTCLPITAAHATDGEFTQILCRDPQTGQGTGSADGITKEGFLLWVLHQDCTTGSTSGLQFYAGAASTPSDGTWAAMLYRPTANLQYKGATIYRSMVVNPADAWGGLIFGSHLGSNIAQAFELPRFETAGERTYNNLNRGTQGVPFAANNRVDIGTTTPSNGFTITIMCSTFGIPGCNVQNNHFNYRLYAGKITLEDSDDPEVSGTPQGSLLTDSILKGTKEVTVNGKDQGSGIFAVRVLVDDNPAVTEVINSNNGRCVDLHPETPQVVETAYRQPCRLSTGGTVQVDTTKLPEGQHNVKIQMCDVGLNCATLANRPGTWIDNVPNVDDPPNPGGSGPGGGNGPGGGSGPGGSGTSLCAIDRSKCSNGTNASANATLVADWSRPSKRSKRERRLIKVVGDKAITTFDTRTVIRGQLINKDNGQPIEGAKVRLLQTPTRPGLFPEDVGGVRTRQNGRFTMIVPRGMPSRKLRFEYRPIEDDAFVAASRDLELAVKSSVVLKLSRRIVHAGTTLKFSGYVRGGHIPKNGKLLVLKVRKNKRGRWVDFKTLRTKPNGRFSFNYRFVQGGRAFYQFVAASPFEEAFPFDTGKSRTRTASKR